MVNAIRSPLHTFATRPHPDANRIAGLAAAITLNAALLMLLLIPMSAPPPLTLPDLIPSLRWIHRTPVPPVPPIHVPIAKPQPKKDAALTQPRIEPKPVDPPIIIDHGTQPTIDPVIDSRPDHADSQGGTNTTPLPGVHLEYADAPAPAYPRDTLREGVQGTVLLQVLVDVDGRPLQVDVLHSSGDRRLDIAARKQVLEHWRFRPAMQDGHAVQAIGLIPIAFNLDG